MVDPILFRLPPLSPSPNPSFPLHCLSLSLPLPFTHTHTHSHTPSCFLDYCWRACLNALPAIGDDDEEEDTEAYEVQPPLPPSPPPSPSPSPAPLSRESSCFTHRNTLSILSFIQRGEILFSQPASATIRKKCDFSRFTDIMSLIKELTKVISHLSGSSDSLGSTAWIYA